MIAVFPSVMLFNKKHFFILLLLIFFKKDPEWSLSTKHPQQLLNE